MNKRDACFAAFVGLTLCAVIGVHFLAFVPGMAAPSKSVLEGRTYTAFPELKASSISNGSVQDALESYVADKVPMRDSVLLGNAAIQRTLIRIANAPVGYDVYPTFYGSDSLCFDPYQAVIEMPLKKSSASAEHIEKMAKRFSSFMKRHEDKRFAFYFVERVSTSQASPAYDLVSDVADYAYYKTHLIDKLPASCFTFDGSYDDTEEFFKDHFTTDHHWQVEGAFNAYEQIIRAFGKEPIKAQGFETVFPQGFYGAMAREGLCIEGDGSYVDDVVYERSPITVTVGGKEEEPSFLDEGYGEDPRAFKLSDTFGSAYAQWFHHPTDPIVITNKAIDKGALLIVGDSSTDNCERFYAENYRTVYKIDTRYFDSTLDEFLDEHDIDDVLFTYNETQYDAKDVVKALK